MSWQHNLDPWAEHIIQAHWLYLRSANEIASWFDCSSHHVRTAITKQGIRVRGIRWEAPEYDEYQIWLCEKYGWSQDRIQKTRASGKRKKEHYTPFIIRDYVVHEEPVDKLGLLYNYSPMTIWRILKRNNVNTRPRGRRKMENK